MSRICVVDDNEIMRESLAETVRRAGHDVASFESALDALNEFKREDFHLVITDLMMPKMSGLEFLVEIKHFSPDTEVILITAYATVENAVQAMKEGAFDYIIKPFNADAIEIVITKALEHQRLRSENEYLRTKVADHSPVAYTAVPGKSKVMVELSRQIDKVANSNATVLIRGESGVGKEVVARALHALSSRCDKPFFAVNCAALSAGLLESELFGHERGAFTGADKMRKGRFELANGGTLMLDEISEIDPGLQAKLLRVLQEKSFERVGSSQTRKVDVRVLATTNRDLKQAIAEKTFREDLYFRINVVTLNVPPLRNRRQDIPGLVDYFIIKFAKEMGKTITGIDTGALRTLETYAWPGNVRELQNVIERAVVLSAGDALSAEDFMGSLDDTIATA
ncbi:sigma-54-dependent transcriptional regulator, partial [Planctomycetota bacterium]